MFHAEAAEMETASDTAASKQPKRERSAAPAKGGNAALRHQHVAFETNKYCYRKIHLKPTSMCLVS